jgi:hypothetical protein
MSGIPESATSRQIRSHSRVRSAYEAACWRLADPSGTGDDSALASRALGTLMCAGGGVVPVPAWEVGCVADVVPASPCCKDEVEPDWIMARRRRWAPAPRLRLHTRQVQQCKQQACVAACSVMSHGSTRCLVVLQVWPTQCTWLLSAFNNTLCAAVCWGICRPWMLYLYTCRPPGECSGSKCLSPACCRLSCAVLSWAPVFGSRGGRRGQTCIIKSI